MFINKAVRFQVVFSFRLCTVCCNVTMNHVNKIFRDAVDMIMNGSYFPSGRKNIMCTAVADIAAGNSIFAASKGSLGDVSLFIST